MRTFKLLFLILLILSLQNLVFAEVIKLPKTGQKACYDSTGNLIPCSNTGQDGDWQTGVSWPNPRFSDNGDGTITDNLTGLMWLKNANCMATEYPSFDNEGTPNDGKVTWQKALDFVAGINAGTFSKCGAGYRDWRLPNVNELESLVHLGFKEESCDSQSCFTVGEWLNSKGFTNFQISSAYWTSTTVASENSEAYFVGFYDGAVGFWGKSFPYYYVLPVRLGQSNNPDNNYPANIPKTGQKESFSQGDDGDLEKGVAIPIPRFTDNGNGTVTDNLTGLIWLRNANCFDLQTWESALNLAKNLSNGQCGLSDGSKEGDWRLPNRKELRSLIDYGRNYPALSEVNPFYNAEHGPYWSSTTHSQGYKAWEVNIGNGSSYESDKNYKRYVWAVRNKSDCTPPFPDVPCDYWAVSNIQWIKDRGITTGYPDGTFRPEASVKRSEMAAFIIRALEGEPASGSYSPNPYFSDVPPTHWAFKYIQRMRERGITSGYAGTTLFGPEDNVTREQMAKMLIMALVSQGRTTEPPADYCSTGVPFTDVNAGMWSCRYIKKLKELGITLGCNPPENTRYCPMDNVKRAQMATFLYRAFGR